MALSSSLVSLGIFVAIYALLALGLNVKYGFTGLLDIGHVTFYLIGAYTTALLVAPPPEQVQFADYVLGWGLSWPVATAIGVVVAAVAGMIVALPAIRLREDYLAITVLGFSVIAQRVVQNESWLANGPRAMRGYPVPLAQYFAMPRSGQEEFVLFTGVARLLLPTVSITFYVDEIIFGLLVAILWTVAAYGLATVAEFDSVTSTRDRLVHGVLAVTLLGVGYWAARRAVAEGGVRLRPAVGAGLAVGLVATVAGILASGSSDVVIFAFMGLLSTYSWLFLGFVVARRYADVDRTGALYGLAMALGLLGALVPLVLLGGGGGDFLSSVGLVLTLGLLVAYVYGGYYFGANWDRLGPGTSFIRVVGLGAIWLFLLRYYVLSIISPLKAGRLSDVVITEVQNVLWLVRFGSGGVTFGYLRFQLVLFVGLVGAVYYLSETTVKSPFGRVLKAIRDDEDAASALGKNTFSYKVQSMMLGSAMAGLAGALIAINFGSLKFLMFAPRVTFTAFLMVIIGGTANNRGVVLGAAVFWLFQVATTDIKAFFPSNAAARLSALRLAVIGALLIVILYYRPGGILGEEETALEEYQHE